MRGAALRRPTAAAGWGDILVNLPNTAALSMVISPKGRPGISQLGMVTLPITTGLIVVVSPKSGVLVPDLAAGWGTSVETSPNTMSLTMATPPK
jgi:hypothetical protein